MNARERPSKRQKRPGDSKVAERDHMVENSEYTRAPWPREEEETFSQEGSFRKWSMWWRVKVKALNSMKTLLPSIFQHLFQRPHSYECIEFESTVICTWMSPPPTLPSLALTSPLVSLPSAQATAGNCFS